MSSNTLSIDHSVVNDRAVTFFGGRAMKIKSLVAGVMMVLAGSAVAGENFATLKGIPAQAMSGTEMAQVEGKNPIYDIGRYTRSYVTPVSYAFYQLYNQNPYIWNQFVGQANAIPAAIKQQGYQVFNQMGNPYGISSNTCAACASSLNGLLGTAGQLGTPSLRRW